MENNKFFSTPDILIQKDRMRLTVSNIYPDFQKKSEQETRREISEKLYWIFKKDTGR